MQLSGATVELQGPCSIKVEAGTCLGRPVTWEVNIQFFHGCVMGMAYLDAFFVVPSLKLTYIAHENPPFSLVNSIKMVVFPWLC